MENQIEKIISETLVRYQRSGHHKSGFYDITLSVISWLVLSQIESKNEFDSSLTENELCFFTVDVSLQRETIAKALKKWEEYKGFAWNNLLQLEPTLIDRIPDAEWQFILCSWENLFAELELSPRLFSQKIFEYLERTIIMELNNEHVHVSPKEVASLMASYLHEDTIGSLYDPFARTGNLLFEASLNLPLVRSVHGFSAINLGWKLASLRLLFSSEKLNLVIKKELAHQSKVDEFDFIISNPPYGQQMINNVQLESLTNEWSDLVRKSNRIEVYYLCHILSRLSDKGKAAVLLPSIFLSGGPVIKELIKRLLSHNLLDAVVALPGSLFTHTNIPTVMLCVNKNRIADNLILIADASKEVIKNGRLNVLKTEQVATWFECLKSQSPKSEATLLLTADDIARQGYNLYVAAYRQEKTLLNKRESSVKLRNEYEELETRIDIARADLSQFLKKRRLK